MNFYFKFILVLRQVSFSPFLLGLFGRFFVVPLSVSLWLSTRRHALRRPKIHGAIIGKNLLAGVLVFVFLFVAKAKALDVVSLFTASCVSETGVIIGVDAQNIVLMNIDGHTKYLPRYEVIYIASYSLNEIPAAQLSLESAPYHLVIQTRQDRELRELVSGWPVDFTENRIGFLTLNGSGAVIDRSNIWRIESTNADPIKRGNTSPTKLGERIELTPPYPFAQCPTVVLNPSGKGHLQVVPERLLGGAVEIKEELDRLMRGHEQIEFYKRRQAYYALPFVYGRQSSLGLWTSVGSRHAQSQNRDNNFLPLLTDERGRGPFSFQQKSVTGVGPLRQGLHEEPQSQFTYEFKSSYVHFGAMLDPSLFLVGPRYKWNSGDFKDSSEDRVAQSSQAFLGVGYGAVVIKAYPVTTGEIGVRGPGLFDRNSVNSPMLGISFQRPDWALELLSGAGSDNDFKISFFRANFDWNMDSKTQLLFSIISRHVQDAPSSFRNTSFGYDGTSSSFSTYAYHRFAKRFDGGAYISYESWKSAYGLQVPESSFTSSHIKGGIYAAIIF